MQAFRVVLLLLLSIELAFGHRMIGRERKPITLPLYICMAIVQLSMAIVLIEDLFL